MYGLHKLMSLFACILTRCQFYCQVSNNLQTMAAAAHVVNSYVPIYIIASHEFHNEKLDINNE